MDSQMTPSPIIVESILKDFIVDANTLKILQLAKLVSYAMLMGKS